MPEKHTEQIRADVSTLPTLITDKGVIVYNKMNVMRNENGCFPLTISNIGKTPVTLQKNIPIALLKLDETIIDNKAINCTITCTNNLTDNNNGQTFSIAYEDSKNLYSRETKGYMNPSPTNTTYIDQSQKCKQTCHSESLTKNIPFDPESSLKVQHRKKVLEEIKQYFHIKQFDELITLHTIKIKNEQKITMSKIISYIKDTHQIFLENTYKLTTLKSEILELKQDINTLKQ